MKSLRQQMTDAMVLRGFAARTQEAYLGAVVALARHTRRPPDSLATAELQEYLLLLITEKKLAYASVNQAACAFRFLFERVLDRPNARFDIPMAKVPKGLPQILSREEVAPLIGAAATLRARTLLMTSYGAGLRVSELCALQVAHIESAPDRMCLTVRQGKGGQDRYTLLSPRLLATLRAGWRVGRPRRWLFPNPAGTAPIDPKTAQRIYGAAREAAGIAPEGGIHSLRHCFATHLLRKPASICPPSSGSSATVMSGPPCAISIWRTATSPGPHRHWNCSTCRLTKGSAWSRQPSAWAWPRSCGACVPAYLATHVPCVARAQVWRAILACRTAALGGHVETCDACGATRHVYHCCRNRHCPLCQTRAEQAWLVQRRRELLPVPYFHLVFTLPHELNGLIGQCPRALYEILFGAVSATLTEFAANPRHLGGMPAFTRVLHTWQQDLGRHVHLHALVAGGALAATGDWVSTKRGFVFAVKALSKLFRGKFVAALKTTRAQAKLRDAARLDEGSWRTLLARLHAHDWVVYAKQPLGGPAQVLEYLSRYTHRVAISNERIVGMDDRAVRFRVRDSANGNKKRTLALPAQTFIEPFVLHVLPKGFKRIRHYAILGPAGKAVKRAQARKALAVPAPDPAVVESVAAFMQRIERIEWARCPHCGKGACVPTATIAPAPARSPPSRGPP